MRLKRLRGVHSRTPALAASSSVRLTRISLLCLAFFATSLCNQAEEILINGDFSNGNDHWLGDGIALSQLPSDNPLARSNSNGENALVVPLRPHGWTKVTQAFHTHAAQYSFIIKFRTSPDIRFTKEKDDYDRATQEIGLWANPLYHQFNHFLYGIVDDSKRIWYAGYCDIAGLKAPHPILERTMNNLSVSDDKTIYLAFPPGEGNIVIQSVSVIVP